MVYKGQAGDLGQTEDCGKGNVRSERAKPTSKMDILSNSQIRRNVISRRRAGRIAAAAVADAGMGCDLTADPFAATRIDPLAGHTYTVGPYERTAQNARKSYQYVPKLTEVAERIDTIVVAVRK